MKPLSTALLCGIALTLIAAPLFAATTDLPGDRMLADYFKQETTRIAAQNKLRTMSLEDWKGEREKDLGELREMLGLSPWPERTDLHPVVTGRIEREDFTVEKLHFQSMPELYVTANLYLPKKVIGKAPAILYVCGHAGIARTPVPFGAKAVYQHHGEWLARNGYVCLVIDPIEVGEIRGVHKGTYRFGLWWWNSRGYTPAGVEAWNSIRALDYLQSRPEVDGDRIGMTGRSGGGAYSWYTAALDQRVKVAAPIAGINDLHEYVDNGFVHYNCDCAFMLNTYRWDYGKLAAMVAPRPLLIGATDRDQIFPLAGVMRVHADAAAIYRLYGAVDKLGLLITEGIHGDSQNLQVPTLHWLNRFLKGEDPVITTAAEKWIDPAKLAVFSSLPKDERTSRAHEFFVPAASPVVPADAAEWRRQKADWLRALKAKSFAAWPDEDRAPEVKRIARATQGGMTLTTWEFMSQGVVRLPLYIFTSGKAPARVPVRLEVLDDQGWNELAASVPAEWSATFAAYPEAEAKATSPVSGHHRALVAQAARGEITLVYLAPRAVGPTRWGGDARRRIVLLRSLQLMGQTLEGMRVWDIHRAVGALRQPDVLGRDVSLELAGERVQAVNALYASLFTEGIASLDLIAPPASHMNGPDYLNVLRYLDVPQAVTMAMERRPVTILDGDAAAWKWAAAAADKLGWPSDRLQFKAVHP